MSTLRIGFANKYYTLWSVGEPFKAFVNKYEYVYKIQYTYHQNLSTDKETAIKKAKEFGVKNLEVDVNLKGKSSSFEIESEKGKRYTTQKDWEYPHDIRHSFGAGDIRNLGRENEIKSESSRLGEIKALWVLYLKKEIWSENHHSKTLNPHWVRPVVYARRRLIDLGLLEKFEGQYLTPKSIYAIKLKRLEVNGHFFADKERVKLNLKVVSKMIFDGLYGVSIMLKMVDTNRRMFIYFGSSNFAYDAEENDNVKLKATIKHDNYKGENQTKLMRPTLM